MGLDSLNSTKQLLMGQTAQQEKQAQQNKKKPKT